MALYDNQDQYEISGLVAKLGTRVFQIAIILFFIAIFNDALWLLLLSLFLGVILAPFCWLYSFFSLFVPFIPGVVAALAQAFFADKLYIKFKDKK